MAERLVYYSFFPGPWADAAMRQLLRSVESLRVLNGRIPIKVFHFGPIAPWARAALTALSVDLEDAGDYRAALAAFCPSRVAEILAEVPVLHYALALARISLPRDAQVLYVDSDTYFLRDVEVLLDARRDLDVYAREEPHSRASHLGHDPALVDEDGLAALAARLGARFVPPFNNGVVIMNHGAWEKIAARLGALLRLVFRISVGLALGTGAQDQPDIVYLREHRARFIDAADEADALPCPSENAWIKDEVALWLTLGTIPDLRVGLLSRDEVLQGDEFAGARLAARVLVHYFSLNTDRFEAWLDGHFVHARVERDGEAPPDRIFEALGQAVEDAWSARDYDEHAFPAIAAAALRAARLERATSASAVARWLLAAPAIPEQDDIAARFGDPPITVYHGRRFFVQVLLWREGSTAIHRHAFDGAFMLLDGSSLHVRYAFDPRRRVSSHLLVGDLRFEGASLLAPGDVHEIAWDLIHATFHLEAPTATVVVRTYSDEEAQPQYDYVPPGVAWNTFYEEPHLARQLQVLDFLRATDHPEADALTRALVARADLNTCWEVLWNACRAIGREAPAAALLDAARERHGEVIDEVAAALHEDLRRRVIGELRRSVDDPGQRFFLALLQNLPTRDAILAIVRARFPEGDPFDRVLAWLDEVSGVDAIGVDFTDDLNRALVRAMMEGRSEAGVLAALEEEFEPEEVAAGAGALAKHCERIRATALGPLFR